MPRLIWVVAFGICLLGCPGSKPNSPPVSKHASEAERPPLRIRVTGSNELVESVLSRWKSISDQPLDLQSVDSEKLLAAESIKADVLIFESRCLPTLVERRWISKLPKLVFDPHPSESPSDEGNTNWPLVWRQSVTYGQCLWGIPLGVPMMVIVENSEEKSSRVATWTERISARKSKATRDLSNESRVAISDSLLLDRFLIVAASMNPQPSETGFLFNINSARSRLNEPWLSNAATTFAELYSDRSNLAGVQPDVAWELVANKQADWALAWPSSRGESSSNVQSSKSWVDLGYGLVASLTTMNRQSSASIRFINWLNEDAQRQEFSAHSPAIQPLPERWTTSSERTDVNRYREIMKRAFDDRFVVHELRFAESFAYRQRLIEALKRVLKDPASAEVELQKCSAEWDKITATNTREIQKRRLALTLDLEAYRD